VVVAGGAVITSERWLPPGVDVKPELSLVDDGHAVSEAATVARLTPEVVAGTLVLGDGPLDGAAVRTALLVVTEGVV
jgi:hypothetical protein